MIRVLHVVPNLSLNDGIMSVIMNYYRSFNRSSVQFDFLYLEETEITHKDEILEMGGRVFFFPLSSFPVSAPSQLCRFFQTHTQEWAIVHCHPIWASIVFALAAKEGGIKHLIAHSHLTVFSEKKLSSVRNRFLSNFIRFFATDFAACSAEAAKLFGKINDTPGKVRIITNAIDWRRYAFSPEDRLKVRLELGIGQNELLWGNVGRLSVQKNQLFFIDVIAATHKKHPSIKFVIIGEGAMSEQLAKRIADYDLNDVCKLLGARTDIPRLLSAMDMFFLPSLFEGVPLSAVEALACGLPCVLSDSITRDLDSKQTLYLPLSKGAEYWAQTAYSFWKSVKGVQREENPLCKNIAEHYDIQRQSKSLEAYYYSLSENATEGRISE